MGERMDKRPLIGISICAVVLLILGSLTNVVGYQTVQSSNQKVISDEIDQRELLFQTIVDIANNKEIQAVILKSQIGREGFFNPDLKFVVIDTPVLTKNQLKQMYIVGLMLSKIISKSKINSMVEQYQVNNQWVQKEITAIIEKDTTIKGELTHLSNSKCDCEDSSGVTVWHFPVICTILLVLGFLSFFLVWYLHIGNNFAIIIEILDSIFNCT